MLGMELLDGKQKPDTITPHVVSGFIVCISGYTLHTRCSRAFKEHTTIIQGNRRE